MNEGMNKNVEILDHQQNNENPKQIQTMLLPFFFFFFQLQAENLFGPEFFGIVLLNVPIVRR